MKKKLLLALLVLLALTQTVSAQEGTVIKVWGFVWTADWLDTLVAGFEAAHPGVTIEVSRFEGDNSYQDTITTTLASGVDVPDIVTLDPLWAGDLIRAGAFAPLEGIESDLNPDDYVAGGWQMCGSEGTQYGVPADLDFNIMFYRTDIYNPAIEAAGLDAFPTNTEDFVRVAQAISTDSVKALLLEQQDWYGFYQGFMTPYNATLTNPEGTEYTFNSPEAVAAMSLYNDLVNTDGVARLWDTNVDGDPINIIKNGEVAAVMHGSWYVSELQDAAPEMAGMWGVAPMPFGPDDRTYHAATGGACFSIPASSPNADMARQFLVYMEQPEQMATYFTIVGGLPALRTAWDHIDLTANNEYLGVPLGGLVADWASGVRGLELPSAEVSTALGEAIYHVTVEGEDPQEALDNAVADSPALQ